MFSCNWFNIIPTWKYLIIFLSRFYLHHMRNTLRLNVKSIVVRWFIATHWIHTFVHFVIDEINSLARFLHSCPTRCFCPFWCMKYHLSSSIIFIVRMKKKHMNSHNKRWQTAVRLLPVLASWIAISHYAYSNPFVRQEENFCQDSLFSVCFTYLCLWFILSASLFFCH